MQVADYDEEVLATYPQLLAGTYARYIDQRDEADQHTTLMALFEALLKYLAAAALGQYLAQGGPPREIATFLGALRRPSLGHWAGLLRGTLAWRTKQALPEEGFIFPTLPRLYRERSDGLPACCALLGHVDGRAPGRTSLGHVFDRLISYRNEEAHGAGGVSDERSALVPALQAALEEVLRLLPELATAELRHVEAPPPEQGGAAALSFLRLMGERPRLRPQRESPAPDPPPAPGRAYLLAGDAYVEVHPLIVFIPSCARCKTPQVGLLNEASEKSAEYLCYACGHASKLPELAADVGALLAQVGVDLLPGGRQVEVPHNLPEQLTSFVGRERDLAEIKRLLGARHLLTLTGTGGSGKTRLALQVASDLLYQFRDGVFFVSLAPLHDAALVLPAIAGALRVQEEGEAPLATLVEQHLRDKQVLLVLDNFEHVIAAAPLLARLLASAPSLHVLVTSEAPLRLYGEQEYPLAPLEVLDLERRPPFEEIARNEAVALFVARAQAVDPSFQLTAENAAPVAEICAGLDGLPLAIELAAARVRLLPPQEMRGRLARRLSLLTGGARDRLPTQQTMRAALAWSYDLLDPASQRLFRRLGVFDGGSSVESCEAVCVAGDPDLDTLDGLDALLSKSLLRQAHQADGRGRFFMLQTVREYALERLGETEEAGQIRGAYCDYFLNLAEQARPALTGAEQEKWLRTLAAEHDNLRGALGLAIERGDTDLALRLGGALGGFWRRQGFLSEGRGWLDRALALGSGDALVTARALNGAAVLATQQCDYARAAELYARALALYRSLDDRGGAASVLTNSGVLARDQGSSEQADAFFAEALEIYRESGDRRRIALTLNNRGVLALDRGELERAESLYAESLALARELGAKAAIAVALNNLGGVAIKQQDYPRAASLLGESLGLRRDLGDRFGVANCLRELARLAASERAPERAARLWGAEELLRESLGAPLPPAERTETERLQAAAREQIDGDSWSAAWSAGRAMSFDQAVSFAMEAAQAASAL